MPSLAMRKISSKKIKRAISKTFRFPSSLRSYPRTGDTYEDRPFPELPPELWIIIIRNATLTFPDPLDSTRAVSFLDLPHSQLQLDHYHESMRQKKNLSLVSRSWYQYTQEFLYEYVWIRHSAQAKHLALTLSSDGCRREESRKGNYIRRLQIQTSSSLHRCSPADLRTILDYSPRVEVFSDQRSLRHNLAEESCNPRSAPAQLFSVLARPNNSLRRLSWTNYQEFSLHLHMTCGMESIAANLEYLELDFCSGHLPAMTDAITLSPDVTQVSLPALRALKVTLDNTTFQVLSTWDLPSLLNLSVLSADFSYAGPGFSEFFRIHGPKVKQLELVHSSSIIEEHYLTVPPGMNQHHHIPLADWCPNLQEFICSADAEWNWENPDWIAPHVLLPTHPKLQFIGIRDIHKRLSDDLEIAGNVQDDTDDSPFFSLLHQLGSLLREEAFPSLRYIRDMDMQSNDLRHDNPQMRIVQFWMHVWERCSIRGVWLEDHCGTNITRRDLARYLPPSEETL